MNREQYKLRFTKTRSDDFVELDVSASGFVAADRLGSALAELMGVDVEYCTKQERMTEKEWSCEAVFMEGATC